MTRTSRHRIGRIALACAIAVARTGPALAASEERGIVAVTPSWSRASALESYASPTDRMDLRIHLRLRDRDAALAEAAALNDPDDPRYGRYLMPDEFRARYSPTPGDVARVRSWLQSHGLAYDYVSGNRLMLAAHGAVARVEAAFDTTRGLRLARSVTRVNWARRERRHDEPSDEHPGQGRCACPH